jgi:general secretion pathway protein H
MHAMWGTGRSRNRGFTLLELLVVIAIMALVSVAIPIALPHLMPRQQLRVDAEMLAATLREARARAVAFGQAQDLRYIRSERIVNRDPDERVWQASRDVGVALRSASTQESADIRFFPDGSSSGGTFELAMDARKVDIEVSPLTGRVRVVMP